MGTIKVLIVDDYPAMRYSIGMYLQDRYDVASAGAARDAFEYMAACPVNLVLLDIRLPGMDGMTALREMKKRYPGTEVIMMTAYASPETIQHAFRLGAHAFFIKPFKLDELADAIDRALYKRLPAKY